MNATRRLIAGSFVALIVLGLAWELWLAPLRPGGSMLALKVLPLVLALPPVARGHVRSLQWWSMLILAYLAEGLVRGMSDVGTSRALGWTEAVIAGIGFAAILIHMRALRRRAQGPALGDGGPATEPTTKLQ